MSAYYVSSTPSSGSHTRGRSRSRNSPPRVAMPSPHFPVSAASTYYPSYPTSDPGHGHGHARHASYNGHHSSHHGQQAPGAGNTYYVARSPSRSGHRRSESHSHKHHRSHSATPHRSSSAVPRHSSSRVRPASTTRNRSSSRTPHRSQSAHGVHVQRRSTYTQPQRRYSTHTSHLSFGDRIRKLLHIGRFGNHGKAYYVDSRGRELDRAGRPIIAY
jgi:hypothetical protein